MPQIVPYEYINIYISEILIIMIIIWRMRNKEIREIIRKKIIRIYIKKRKEW